jgi:hypothetical protein
LSLAQGVFANELADHYINTYKDVAIAEMERTGIPASIKLAQGLLESDWGRSQLASEANNHFGIKCGGSWNGDTYYLEDDDKDHKGRIIASCFRVFDSAMESYMAHSAFLTEEDRASRYAFLFEYDPTDYKAWAKGLKKAGYATDRKYPQKLISIIEKYELHKFDLQSSLNTREEEVIASEASEEPDPSRSRLKPSKPANLDYKVGIYSFSSINGLRITKAFGGESMEELAARTGSKVEDLMKYNEDYGFRTYILDEGDIVYFKKKKRSYNGEEEFHVVMEGEDMFMISQLYGIKLDNLYAKNKMPKGSEPLTGQRLYLKNLAPKGDRPLYTKHPKRGDEIEFLFADESSGR